MVPRSVDNDRANLFYIILFLFLLLHLLLLLLLLILILLLHLILFVTSYRLDCLNLESREVWTKGWDHPFFVPRGRNIENVLDGRRKYIVVSLVEHEKRKREREGGSRFEKHVFLVRLVGGVLKLTLYPWTLRKVCEKEARSLKRDYARTYVVRANPAEVRSACVWTRFVRRSIATERRLAICESFCRVTI